MLYPPIVMLEGTGPLDPNGVEHAEADADAEEVTARVFAGHRLLVARLRQMFHYRSDGKKQSPFYKVVKIASTPQLAYRGCGQLLFMALMASGGTAGVPFQDIATASDRITFVPQLELSDPQLAEMRSYLLDLHPQPGLSPPGLGAPLPHVALAREQMARVRGEMERACVPSTRHRMAIRLAKYQHFDAAGLFVGQLIDAVVG